MKLIVATRLEVPEARVAGGCSSGPGNAEPPNLGPELKPKP